MDKRSQALPAKLETVLPQAVSMTDIGTDAYDRMDDGYQAMAELAASLTLDDLRRDSVPVFDIEDAVA